MAFVNSIRFFSNICHLYLNYSEKFKSSHSALDRINSYTEITSLVSEASPHIAQKVSNIATVEFVLYLRSVIVERISTYLFRRYRRRSKIHTVYNSI